MDVVTALLAIRDGRLYRDTYETFEAYCRDRWGVKRAHAYRMIQAAETVAEMSPVGDVPLPTNERHVRELARLPDPVERAEAWESTVSAHGPRPTAARERVTNRPHPPRLEPT